MQELEQGGAVQSGELSWLTECPSFATLVSLRHYSSGFFEREEDKRFGSPHYGYKWKRVQSTYAPPPLLLPLLRPLGALTKPHSALAHSFYPTTPTALPPLFLTPSLYSLTIYTKGNCPFSDGAQLSPSRLSSSPPPSP